MNLLLICPDRRAGFEAITAGSPLALATFLGKPIIEHFLDAYSRMGYRRCRVLVCDRPGDVRAHLSNCRLWDMDVAVCPESDELSLSEAEAKHAEFEPDTTASMDQFPVAGASPPLTTAVQRLEAARDLLPTLVRTQVGTSELAPGVWAGPGAKIHPSSTLTAPCWIGASCSIGSGATIGPGAFVETGSLVDRGATIENSHVQPDTYVGTMMEVSGSLVSGCRLQSLASGSLAIVHDPFFLSSLNAHRRQTTNRVGQLLAGLSLVLTSPIAVVAIVLAALRGRPVTRVRDALLDPQDEASGGRPRISRFRDFTSLGGSWNRWPRLINVLRREFAWAGNPPIGREEAAGLSDEWEQRWLDAPPGVFTAPESEGCVPPWDDLARSHATLFACMPTPRWRRRIVLAGLKSLIVPARADLRNRQGLADSP